jgi:hypothetical protein
MVSHMLTFYTIFIYGELLLMIDDCLMVFSYLIMFIAMLNYQPERAPVRHIGAKSRGR